MLVFYIVNEDIFYNYCFRRFLQVISSLFSQTLLTAVWPSLLQLVIGFVDPRKRRAKTQYMNFVTQRVARL